MQKAREGVIITVTLVATIAFSDDTTILFQHQHAVINWEKASPRPLVKGLNSDVRMMS